jgi:peptidyl-prolyl cis-trans isomerase C
MHSQQSKWVWTLGVIFVLVLVGLSELSGEEQPPEGKVAVVNGSVITRAAFERERSRIQQRLVSRGKPLSDSQLLQIKKEALENLISRELLYQESQKRGVTIDETVINEQLRKLKERFPSEDEFKSALTKANLSEAAIKSEFRRAIAIQQFVDKEFVRKITITEEESKTYYDSHPDLFKQPEQVRASHILIKVGPGADTSQKAEARKKLEKIQGRVNNGEDFSALARERSEGPSSARGGDLGYFGRGKMVKPFEEAALALRPGEVSDIVETEFGYHLIKVFDKKPQTTIAYEKIEGKIKQYLKQDKVQKEVNRYVEKLKEDAKVERFLMESSS